MTVEVRPAVSRSDRAAFIELPYRLHAADPNWVPPLRMAERQLLDTQKNPFFDHAVMQQFLARRDGAVVGRIAAIDNARHNEVHGDNLAFFGFFEATDGDVAGALLGAAEDWARERGREVLRGPANPSLNDTAGMLVEGHDRPPVLLMPYNPPTYGPWVEAAGFHKAKDLWALWFDIAGIGVNDRIRRIVKRINSRLNPVPTIRSIDLRNYEREVDTMHHLFNAAWKDNWGFVPPTREEFHHAAAEMKFILYPQLAKFLEVDGRPVAFAVTLPDINQILIRMGGRLRPTGLFKLLLRRRFTDQGRMLLLGVEPEYRGKGLELALIAESIEYVRAHLGWHGGECSWTLEDNDGINKAIVAVGGEHYKTYRIYEKKL